MIRRPPRSTRTDTLFPYTSLFRSAVFQTLRRFHQKIGLMPGSYFMQSQTPSRPPIVSTAYILNSIGRGRSEEHTSELQSLMRISYAVFCLNKKNYETIQTHQQSKVTHILNKLYIDV